MHQLLFLYILNYPVIYSLSERESKRERAVAHMQVTLFTLAWLKKVSTPKNLYDILVVAKISEKGRGGKTNSPVSARAIIL